MGFLLKHRVKTLFRRIFRRRCSSSSYRRLKSNRVKPVSRLMRWTQRLRTKAKLLLGNNVCSDREYVRVGHDPILEQSGPIPKGHMAVYVGLRDGDFQRILVPVMYMNHPLFGDLLKESEKEFGFNHPGGITIPCRISEFERVQTRIKAVQCSRKLPSCRY
ncbi:hypothetical protein ACS0TY_019651 [Phlomoides rotata]